MYKLSNISCFLPENLKNDVTIRIRIEVFMVIQHVLIVNDYG